MQFWENLATLPLFWPFRYFGFINFVFWNKFSEITKISTAETTFFEKRKLCVYSIFMYIYIWKRKILVVESSKFWRSAKNNRKWLESVLNSLVSAARIYFRIFHLWLCLTAINSICFTCFFYLRQIIKILRHKLYKKCLYNELIFCNRN